MYTPTSVDQTVATQLSAHRLQGTWESAVVKKKKKKKDKDSYTHKELPGSTDKRIFVTTMSECFLPKHKSQSWHAFGFVPVDGYMTEMLGTHPEYRHTTPDYAQLPQSLFCPPSIIITSPPSRDGHTHTRYTNTTHICAYKGRDAAGVPPH